MRVWCVRLILVLVGEKNLGFSKYLYVLCTRYVCTWYQPATQIRMYLVLRTWYQPADERSPVDAHVWRQLHVSAVARCSDSYWLYLYRVASVMYTLVCVSMRVTGKIQSPHPGGDISNAPVYDRRQSIYTYINCKTAQEARSLHSDLLIESFQVQQPGIKASGIYLLNSTGSG